MPLRRKKSASTSTLEPKGTGSITTHPGTRHAAILGVGGYRPKRVVDNHEICEVHDSSDEWIRERSGIVTRHFAGDGESVVDMSEESQVAYMHNVVAVLAEKCGETVAQTFVEEEPHAGTRRGS